MTPDIPSSLPSAAAETPRQVPENVSILVEHARELASVERDRTDHADTRAVGLAVVANGLLGIAATLGGRLGQFAGAGWIESTLPIVFGVALLLLLSAGISAALALRLTAAPTFRTGEVDTYRAARTQLVEPLRLQQRILTGWVAAVASERLTYDAKTRYLRAGYRLFVLGLVALVGVAVTLASCRRRFLMLSRLRPWKRDALRSTGGPTVFVLDDLDRSAAEAAIGAAQQELLVDLPEWTAPTMAEQVTLDVETSAHDVDSEPPDPPMHVEQEAASALTQRSSRLVADEMPSENAGLAGLRRVIDEETVQKVLAVLADEVSKMPKNWNRRFKHNRDKIKTGDIYELAEVVRNLAFREHEEGLSTGEKQMFTTAKKLLASELMSALDKDQDEALDYIDKQLADVTDALGAPRDR